MDRKTHPLRKNLLDQMVLKKTTLNVVNNVHLQNTTFIYKFCISRQLFMTVSYNLSIIYKNANQI